MKGCEVHLWHSFTGVKETALREIVAQFEAENSYGIRLRVEFHAHLDQEVPVAVAAGTPPDLVQATRGQIAQYASDGWVAPLDEYVEHPKFGFSKTESADVWPIAFEAGRLWPAAQSLSGLFFDGQAVVMYYNTGWLKELDLDEPPSTWEDMAKVCSQARDRAAGTWGYVFAPYGTALLNWIVGAGGSLVGPTDRAPVLDSPEAVAALTWLSDNAEKGSVYCVSGRDTSRADFAAEKVLFTLGSTAELPAYTQAITNTKTKKARFNWSVAPLPHATNAPVVSVEGTLFSILRSTPRQQLAAWIFLRWLFQPSNDARWALATGTLPITRSSQGLPEMQAYLEQNPQYKVACQLMAFGQPEPDLPCWEDVSDLLTDTATSVCQGNISPAEALSAADFAADVLAAR